MNQLQFVGDADKCIRVIIIVITVIQQHTKNLLTTLNMPLDDITFSTSEHDMDRGDI